MLTRLHELTLLLHQQSTDQAVIEILAREVPGLVTSDGGGIWLWYESTQALELVAKFQTTQSQVFLDGETCQHVARKAYKDNKIRLIDDTLTLADSGLGALLVVPFGFQGITLGVISLARSQPNSTFRPEEMQVIEILSMHLGDLVHSIRLAKQTDLRSRETEAVSTLLDSLADSQGIEEICQRSARLISAQFELSRCEIYAWDKVRNIVMKQANFSPASAELASGRYGGTFSAHDLSSSPVTLAVLQELKPIIHQATNPPPNPADTGTKDGSTGSILLEVAMITRGEAIGAVRLFRLPGSAGFSDHEIHLVQLMANQTAAAIRNAEFSAAARTRVKELTTLFRISETLSLASDIGSIFNSARREIMALTNATGVGIALLDEDKAMLHWIYIFEYGQELVVHDLKPNSIDKGFSGYVVRTGSPLLENNITAERMAAFNSEIIAGAHTLSYMGLPIKVANEIIGVLAVEHNEVTHAFTKHDLQFMAAIASTLGVAIQNQRLLDRTQAALVIQSQQSVQLQAAAEVSSAASQILEVDALLRQVVDLIQERFGLYYVGLFLVDEQSQQAILRAGTGEAGRIQLELGHQLEVGGRSLIGGATSDGQPRIVQNVKLEEEWRPNSVLPDTRSELALPLQIRGRILGALTVQSTKPGEFTTSFVTILQTMGDQLATAINNAQLLAATRTFSSQLRVAAEVSQAVSTILDPNVLLEEVVELIREAFELYYVGLFLTEADEWAILRAGTGQAGRLMLAEKHQLQVGGRSMIGQAIGRDTAIVERNVTAAADWLRNPYLPHTRSEAAVPLRTRGRIIGALTFQSTAVDGFSAGTITVLQTVADQLATAVENASLFAQIQNNLAETSRLYRFGRQISEMHQALELFESLVEFAAGTGLVDSAQIVAGDPNTPNMVYVPALWARYHVEGNPQAEFGWGHFPIAEQLAPKEVTFFTYAQEESYADPALDAIIHRFQWRNVALVPIQAQRRWIATLVLNRLEGKPLQQSDLQSFLSLAEQASVVLVNQQLMLEISALYQVSRALNQATSKDQVLRTTISEIVQYTGAEQCRVVLYDRAAGYGRVAAELIQSDKSRTIKLPLSGDKIYDSLNERRQPLLLKDDGASSNKAADFYLRPFGLKAALIIPAISRHELIGFVSLDSFGQSQQVSESNISFVQAVVDQFTISYERIGLFDEAIQLARDVVVLNRIGAQFSGTLDLDELALVAYEQAGALLDNTIFMLALYDHNTNFFQPLLVVDDGEFKRVAPRTISPTEPVFSLLQNGQPLLGSSETPLAIAEAELFDRPAARHPQSLLWAPIMQDNRPIGLLSVQSYQPNAYRQGDIQLLGTIATQASLAISNARLFAETYERAAEWQQLFGITESAASSVDIDERLRNIVAALFDSLRGADVAIMLVNEDSAQLETLIQKGSNGASESTALFGSLAGQVAQLGQPLMINDLRELPEYQVHGSSVMSQLVVPLNLGGRTIGVINIQSQQVDAFTERDLRLLQTTSVSLAATIQTGRLFREIQNANERLRELDRLKTQFLANMSHELRTPLNSIIGFSKVILNRIDGPITTEQEEDLMAIHSSGQHLLSLINDILDLAKIEAGKMALAFEAVDLEEMTRSVHATCRGLVKDKEIELVWEIEPELPLIQADPVRLRQILLNFLSNAAKFTEKGRIGLAIKRHGKDKVLVNVSDTGVGIPENDFGKLFEAFEQLDATPARNHGGTGLGLPITRRLIDMHQGELWVESEVGQGTTFSFLLPIRQDDEWKSGANAGVSGPAFERIDVKQRINQNGQPTILIVDDEPGVVSLYRRYLRHQPFQLISANSGTRALELIREGIDTIRLILLDINLPDLSGWDVLQETQNNPQTSAIPIIVCSIESEPVRASQLGAKHFLPKPVLEDDLVKALVALGITTRQEA